MQTYMTYIYMYMYVAYMCHDCCVWAGNLGPPLGGLPKLYSCLLRLCWTIMKHGLVFHILSAILHCRHGVLDVFHIKYVALSSVPTQLPTLSGTGNEYRPKCNDTLWLGSKGGYGSSHLWINVSVVGETQKLCHT